MVEALESPANISIHALRGEGDSGPRSSMALQTDFYPRPPWGGRLRPQVQHGLADRFLSTPSVGRATDAIRSSPAKNGFLSTPSVGRATASADCVGGVPGISIHALRGEGDAGKGSYSFRSSPFLSTPSVGRATGRFGGLFDQPFISIHALRGEGDKSPK